VEDLEFAGEVAEDDCAFAGHVYSSAFAPLHLLPAQSDYRKNSSDYELGHALTQPNPPYSANVNHFRAIWP
jgi:hypothetical protein